MKIFLFLLLASIAWANVLPVVPYAPATTTTTPTTTTPTVIARRDESLPPNCRASVLAVPGDTCQSMADKNGMNLLSFVSINPQIGGLANCPQKLWAYSWYCVRLLPWATNLTPGPTLLGPAASASPNPPHPVTATANPPPPTTLKTTTSSPPPPPPTITAPPPPPSCALNDCYRGFHLALYGAAKSQSSWCTSLLQAAPPVTHLYYSDFPGAGPVVNKMCHHGQDEVPYAQPAYIVFSSYCNCYTAGVITGPALTSSETRVDGLTSLPLRRAVRTVGFAEGAEGVTTKV
ncbi:hypothetical protein DL546_005078 [Coniochaeta pulveracea]|uniref:LysM domain-containing protein n=1 Tax=Coniochaeta pulveracea TaxID=177199 RepID=A0A420YMF1_9PEZI|nr:hypothetical protein DL546_005078 [Coniochaeta pulveracea]